jgi:hypothetical protein
VSRAPITVAVAVALALAAGGTSAEAGSVRAKPRSCTPRHTHVVDRRKGVIFSQSREISYACAVWVGHSFNMYGPIYKELFAPSDRGCDLGTNVVHIRVRGERVRYRLVCGYSFGVDQSGTVRWRSVLNLRSGLTRYHRLR